MKSKFLRDGETNSDIKNNFPRCSLHESCLPTYFADPVAFSAAKFVPDGNAEAQRELLCVHMFWEIKDKCIYMTAHATTLYELRNVPNITEKNSNYKIQFVIMITN